MHRVVLFGLLAMSAMTNAASIRLNTSLDSRSTVDETSTDVTDSSPETARKNVTETVKEYNLSSDETSGDSRLNNNNDRLGLCEVACFQKMEIVKTDAFGMKEQCLREPECHKCYQSCQRLKSPRSPPLYPLSITSMVRRDLIVFTHITWYQPPTTRNCFVTWEVAGGGLVGNLLTETSSAELSLWPETEYRVQVTCKMNKTGVLVKTPMLVIDTSGAAETPSDSASESDRVVSNIETNADYTNAEHIQAHGEEYKTQAEQENHQTPSGKTPSSSASRQMTLRVVVLKLSLTIFLVVWVLFCCKLWYRYARALYERSVQKEQIGIIER